jgi:NDP-sugar pyrophosphorylase family protein
VRKERISIGVILAGGGGTRLRPVLPDSAKSVAPVNGRPFIGRLLEQVAAAGVQRIILCTGYRGQDVEAAAGREHRGITIVYSVEERPLGTAGALKQAHDSFGDGGPWVVMNGDSYCAIDLGELAADHLAAGLDATIAVVEADDAGRFGSVVVSPDRRVTRFFEKQQRPGGGPGWVNAGVYVFSERFLAALPAEIPLSLEVQVFPQWLPQGIHAFARRARFIDIGTPESYALAQQFFMETGGASSRTEPYF